MSSRENKFVENVSFFKYDFAENLKKIYMIYLFDHILK